MLKTKILIIGRSTMHTGARIGRKKQPLTLLHKNIYKQPLVAQRQQCSPLTKSNSNSAVATVHIIKCKIKN